MPNVHHVNSPSSLHRRRECPGSARLELDLPETESEYAEEGRLLHHAVWNRHERAVLTADQMECLEVCDSLLASLPVKEWHVEKALSLIDEDTFDTLTEGTADGVGLGDDGAVYVIDWKFGRNEVSDPECNLQLAAYAAAAMAEFNCPTAHCYLVQPRSGKPVRSCTFTDREAIVFEIRSIIIWTEMPQLTLRVGDHCQYCKAQKYCSAVAATAESLVVWGTTAIAPNTARDLYDKAKVVERVIKMLLDGIKQTVKDAGGEVPGLKIQSRAGNRFCPDVTAAFKAVADLYQDTDFLGFCTLAVTDFETDYAKRAMAAGKATTLADGKKLFNQRVPLDTKAPSAVLSTTKQEEVEE